MSFTVTRPGGPKDLFLEFAPYSRLMNKRGLNLADLQRVLDPEAHWLWLPVWEERAEAEEFGAELRKTSKDKSWYVRELDSSTPTSVGPLGPITINVNCQSNDWVFGLDPYSRALIERRFPKAIMLDHVVLASKHPDRFRQTNGQQPDPLDQMASLLTGLYPEQLALFGGYRLYDPVKRASVREPRELNVR